MNAPGHHVAIYDGGCSLCSDFAVLLRKLVAPAVLDVVPCGSAIQKKLAPQVELRECALDFMLVRSDGGMLKGVDAVREALLLSSWFRRMRPLFMSRMGMFAARIIHLGARRRRARKGCCGKAKATAENQAEKLP
ncbi:MAG: DCC1-like thiol-disulfide oxidoreductase family protein [Candidatus Hydrogenedentota bacterium]